MIGCNSGIDSQTILQTRILVHVPVTCPFLGKVPMNRDLLVGYKEVALSGTLVSSEHFPGHVGIKTVAELPLPPGV